MASRSILPLIGLTSASLLCVTGARAEPLVIEAGGEATLSGNCFRETADIAGELRVKTYAPGVSGSGWLHLRANTITITSEGSILASERGYRGDKSVGQGPGAGGTVTGLPLSNATPGGGGAHLGNGGDGIKDLGGCGTIPGSEGGKAYDSSADPLGLLGLGSSGGASQAGTPNDTQVLAGGHGGAVVMLTAATIVIDGKILADGQSPQPNFGGSPGGGAGGTILITTSALTLGPSALLSAAGGTGARKAQAQDKPIGGSGGGGLVVIKAPAASHVPEGDGRIDVSGGPPPETGLCEDGTRGGDGELAQVDFVDCVDADGDGHPNKACGGDDCNDGDPELSPSASEHCNGIDDNCNDDIDEQLPDAPPLCASGSGEECDPVSGSCVKVEQDGGTGGAGPGGAPEIELGGGICAAIAPGAAEHGGWLSGAWAAMLGLLLLRRRTAS